MNLYVLQSDEHPIDESVCLVVDVSYMDRLKGHEKTAFTAVLFRLFAEILCNRLREMDDRILALNDENSRLKHQLELALRREGREEVEL